MVKIHNNLVKIYNNSGFDMTYKEEWYDSGRVADGFSWPKSISNGDHREVLNYERDWSLAGCSGYVTYEMGGHQVTIAFSNPSVGVNKLGVGTNGKGVWDDMGDHDYKPFVVQITVNGVRLNFNCKCTGSTTNTATVDISRAAS